MNTILKSVLRFPALRAFNATTVSLRSTPVTKAFARTLFSTRSSETLLANKHVHTPSMNCMCGCNAKFVHTKGERELVEFLAEEITGERRAAKAKKVPTDVEGFQVTTNGAEVEMTKQNDKEKIVISFNVNHTVDAEGEEEEASIDPNMDKPNLGEMKSSPQFEVDIIREGKTISFTCSFLHEQSDEEGYNDIFGIDEVTFFEGEHSDKAYAVAGDVLDGYLYDLLMNLLEEKGVSNDFVEKLSQLATVYEHSLYVNFLESVSKFTVGGK